MHSSTKSGMSRKSEETKTETMFSGSVCVCVGGGGGVGQVRIIVCVGTQTHSEVVWIALAITCFQKDPGRVPS